MRIVFSALPAYGHVFPLMPLAEAARACGDDVVIATGEPLAGQLAAAGWQTRVVPSSIDEAGGQLMRDPSVRALMRTPEVWKVGALLFAGGLARKVAGALAGVLADVRADLVVYEEMNMGAGVAAGLAGIPAVRHGLGPWLPPPMQELSLGMLAELWAESGSTPPDAAGLLGAVHLDIFPPSLGRPDAVLPIPRAPMRSLAWDLPGGVLPPVVTAPRTRPLVYFSFGTVRPDELGSVRAALTGLAALDIDVLASVGPGRPAELGHISDSIHLEEFVPQAAVLGHVDAVMHHGGAGTTLQSLGHGLPQLVVPQQGHDQFINADVIAGAGAGLALLPGQLNPGSVVEAVRALLDQPSFRASAVALQREQALLPDPVDLLPLLSQIAAGVVPSNR